MSPSLVTRVVGLVGLVDIVDIVDIAASSASSASSVVSGASPLVSASPVTSEVFAAMALVVLSLVVLLILRYYLPLRTTPAYLLVPVFFALWLPANIILLVPIDLASNAQTDDEATRGVWLPQSLLRVSWRITYWLTFALTWFILPILGEYSDAGYREPKDRLLYSLRSNAQYHAMVFGSGIVALSYAIVVYGFTVDSIKGIVMALAYCWGLILAIYLMGHGLVAIPRRLIRTATPSRRLRRLQTLAPGLYEQLEESEADLRDVERQVAELSRRKTGSALGFLGWIEELADSANLPYALLQASGGGVDIGLGIDGDAGAGAGAGASSRTVPAIITKKYMADLTRRLVRARHTRSRYLSEWNRLLARYSETHAVLNSAASKRLERGRPSPGAGLWDRTTVLTPYARYVAYYHVVPAARVALGVLLGLASAAIVWSELVKSALPTASVIRLTVVHHWTGDKGQVGLAGQLIATVWILYMCAAALTSVTEVKVWRGRALVKRNTAHESAFWYASQVARLSVPLTYNFMTFLSKSIYQKTVFYDFLGRLITFTTLGSWFDFLLPTFILLPVLATLFGLYGRVRRLFGFGELVDLSDGEDDDLRGYGTGSWREGQHLIEHELNGTSTRQRRLEAATRHTHHHAAAMHVPGGRRFGTGAGASYTDDPEDAALSPTDEQPTTPFAISPSSSGILPPAPGRTRTLGGRGGASAGHRQQQQQQQHRRFADAGDGDDEDDSFFQQLSHRMKNTIDTIEPPRWFHDIGQGFKKPRWMSGGGSADNGDSSDSGQGSSRAPAQQSAPSDGSGFRRWFGGNDGRIRL